MTTKRTITALFIIFILTCNLIQPAYAATAADTKIKAANKAIQELQDIGIKLTKTNKSNLDKTMTEKEAYDLLTNLDGMKKGEPSNPKKTMTISSYLTKILHLLGYSITDNDKYTDTNQYTSPINKAVQIGLIKKSEYTSKTKLLRADAILLFRRALELDRVGDYQSLKYMVTGNTKYWINTLGKGNDYRRAGVFYEDFNPNYERADLVKLDSNDSYSTNLSNLNTMLFWVYSYSYDTTGSVNKLWQYGQKPVFAINPKNFAEISYDKSSDQYKLTVNSWRNTYNSDMLLNFNINCVFETFYFLTGDKEVAYALFSWIDNEVIHGYKDPKNFGFKNIDVKGKSGTIEMNGIKIKFENTKDHNSYYFMNTTNKNMIPTSADSIDTAKEYKLNDKIRDVKKFSDNVYYKIKTTSNNSYYYFRSRTNSLNDYVTYKLLDDTGLNTIATFSTDVNDGKLYIKLEPNSTYYLVASDGKKDTTEYILHVREIKDDFTDNLEDAKDEKSIDINKIYTGKLETTDDVDYIKFKTGAAADYTIHTHIFQELSLDYIVYDENSNQVANWQRSSRHMYRDVKLKPNTTYYLRLKFYSYSIVDFDYELSIIGSDAVKLNTTNLTLTKGKSATLQINSKIPADSVDYITWYPGDYSIVKTNYEYTYGVIMDKITVTGLKKGKTKITCTYVLKDGNNIYLDCNVIVK